MMKKKKKRKKNYWKQEQQIFDIYIGGDFPINENKQCTVYPIKKTLMFIAIDIWEVHNFSA